MDVGTIYAGTRQRVIELVTSADAEAVEQAVPATPEWNGRQVLAHLVGVASDVLAQRFEGAATDPWTARHVAERESASVAELVDEWRGTAESFDALVAGQPVDGMLGALANDAVQHEFDLRGLLGGPVPDEALDAVEPLLNFMIGFLDRRVKKSGLAALQLVAGNQEWTVGPGQSAVAATLRTTPVELFRVIVGRRSEEQVRAFDWDGDPGPYLPVFSAFGSLSPTAVAEHYSA